MAGLRAALYLRQSLDPTGLGAAIERQRQDCVALADSHGWHIVAEFVDNDVSATARRRPGFEALQSAAAAAEFEVIIAWHVDRIVRRLADLEPVLATCRSLNIQIATVTGEIDPSTDTGRLVARILSSVAQAEVERKAARQARANRQRAEAGIVRLVRRPFGYDMSGRVQRREANALRWAADRILDGASFAQVSRELNGRGITTSTGRPWRASSLTKVLRNPRYAGLATYHGEPVADGRWTPILPLDVHRELAQRIQSLAPQVNAGPPRRHLLSGVAICGRCDSLVNVNVDGRTGRLTYRCPRLHLSRRLDLVDETVTSALFGHLRALHDSALGAETSAHQPAVARQVRLEATSLMRLTTTRWLAGELDDAQWAHASRQLRTAIRAHAQRTTHDSDRLVEAGMRAASRAHPDRSLTAFWEKLDAKDRRDLVRALVRGVRILPAGRGFPFRPDQVEIHWNREP